MQFFPSFSVFLKIGSLEIHYYALCIITGALIAYELGQYRFKKLGYARNMLLGIIGARIWYVIFMWNELYAANPMEIFAVWHGGLAIQGGIFAGLIYSAYFFKKHEIPFLVAGDAIMPGVLIAQALGRWGNFFNHEAYGMYIENAYHHPTFLYESVGNVIVFLVIILLVRHFAKKNGTQFFSYFVGYGIVRFFVEGMRTDSLMLGPLRIAQVISLIFIAVGIGGMLYVHKKGTLRPDFS